MIPENIKTLLETFLNANTSGVVFKLFSDTGEITSQPFEENYTENKVVGLVEFLPSNIVGQGLQFLQLETKMTIYIDGTRVKQAVFNQRIDRIKTIINDVIKVRNRIPAIYNIGGVNYNTTISFGLPQNLDIVSLGYMKKALPIEVYSSWTILLNGVSSDSVEFYVDGEKVTAITWNIDRVRTCEANAKSGEEHTRTIEKVNGINITLNTPLLANNLGNILYEDVMKGETNNAHLVDIEKGNRHDYYICIFGDNGLSGQEGLNVGSKFVLVEGDEDLMNFGEGWSVLQVEVEDGGNVALPITDSGIVFWGDGTIELWGPSAVVIGHDYEEAGTYNIKLFGGKMREPELVKGVTFNGMLNTLAGGFDNIETIVFDNYDDETNKTYNGETMTGGVVVAEGFGDVTGGIDAYYLSSTNKILVLGRYGQNIKAGEDCSRMFRDMVNCEYIDIRKVDFSGTKNMSSMFNKTGSSAVSVEVYMQGINTSKVENMSSMFSRFGENANFIDIYGFTDIDVEKVEDMSSMFNQFGRSLNNFNLNFSNFKTHSLKNTQFMFSQMATSVSNLELDLSSFYTSRLEKMDCMFEYMTTLKKIKVNSSKWSTRSVTNGTDVFIGCTNLVGGAGTTYNSSKVDYTYAKVDGGVGNEGYLTEA